MFTIRCCVLPSPLLFRGQLTLRNEINQRLREFFRRYRDQLLCV